MDLREALAGVTDMRYAPGQGRRQPAQQHLRRVYRELPGLLPAGLSVLVSGAGQSLPYVPWIAVLNPEVTTTAQEGLYVVYLYRSDLRQVYLTMNQGATQHRLRAEEQGLRGRAAERQAIAELLVESQLFRKHLSAAALAGLLGPEEVDLGEPGRFYPEAYEAGTIAGKRYTVRELLAEDVLRADLARFLALYDSCVEVNDELRATDPEAIHTTARAVRTRRPVRPKPPRFRPKSAAEYTVTVWAQQQIRERRHEALIRDFGSWVQQRGLVAATNVHPRDLVVTGQGREWLVEAKVVKANAELAVREAIGQLFAYRHFFYRAAGRPDPLLVALFSEDVEAAFTGLLSSLGIEAIWWQVGEWRSSSSETDSLLCQPARY
jgi:hypothetical protein